MGTLLTSKKSDDLSDLLVLYKRVLAACDRDDECFVFTGNRSDKSGRVKYRGAQLSSKRIAAGAALGQWILTWTRVATSCGNKYCVVPNHLVIDGVRLSAKCPLAREAFLQAYNRAVSDNGTEADRICIACCDYFNVSMFALKSSRQRGAASMARRAAWALMRCRLGMSTRAIGALFGGRSHNGISVGSNAVDHKSHDWLNLNAWLDSPLSARNAA